MKDNLELQSLTLDCKTESLEGCKCLTLLASNDVLYAIISSLIAPSLPCLLGLHQMAGRQAEDRFRLQAIDPKRKKSLQFGTALQI